MDTHIYTYTMLFLPREYNANDAVFRYKLKPPPPKKKRPLTGRCGYPRKKLGEYGCLLFVFNFKNNFVI